MTLAGGLTSTSSCIFSSYFNWLAPSPYKHKCENKNSLQPLHNLSTLITEPKLIHGFIFTEVDTCSVLSIWVLESERLGGKWTFQGEVGIGEVLCK